jgi:hypothetical protein
MVCLLERLLHIVAVDRCASCLCSQTCLRTRLDSLCHISKGSSSIHRTLRRQHHRTNLDNFQSLSECVAEADIRHCGAWTVVDRSTVPSGMSTMKNCWSEGRCPGVGPRGVHPSSESPQRPVTLASFKQKTFCQRFCRFCHLLVRLERATPDKLEPTCESSLRVVPPAARHPA